MQKGRVRRWKLPTNWRPRSEHKSNCLNVKILKRNERMSVQSVGRVSPWIGCPLTCSWRCLNLSLFYGISLLSSNIEIMLFYVSFYSHLSHFFFRILNNNMARSYNMQEDRIVKLCGGDLLFNLILSCLVLFIRKIAFFNRTCTCRL